MKFEDMESNVAYRITKPNSDGGLGIGDIVSYTANENMIDVWDGGNSGAYDSRDLEDPAVTDFECEVADDYEIVVSRWSIECHKV